MNCSRHQNVPSSEHAARKYAFAAIILVSTALISLSSLSKITNLFHRETASSPPSSSSPSKSASSSSSSRELSNLDSSYVTISDDWPELAWIASYPHSGDSLMRKIFHMSTQMTMATNYKYNVNTGTNDPVDHIPFRIRGDLPIPKKWILTETHCVGHCMDCYEDVYINDMAKFQKGCATGKFTDDDDDRRTFSYNPEAVKKIVHLIKNPFDNIVIRFIHEYYKYQQKNHLNWKFEMNRNGLIQWCRDFDENPAVRHANWLSEDLVDLGKDIPCRGLFTQYISWHNNVVDMIRVNKMPFRVVHYDDLGTNMSEIMEKLFKFLDLRLSETEGKFPPVPQDDYTVFYTDEDRVLVSSYMKVLAARAVWTEIKRYLPPPEYEKRYSPIGTVLSPVHYGSWPKIAWAMTFPNSGTHYIVEAISESSGDTSAATNYQDEAGKHNIEDIPNFSYTKDSGPYRYSDDPFPKNYVITKTHCQRCHDCSPGGDLKIDSDAFLKGCATIGKYDDEGNIERDSFSYDPKIVKKAIHLIRNPFDNIVANFHFYYKQATKRNGKPWRFAYNETGFRDWCKFQDSRFSDEDLMMYGKQAADFAKKTPCHGVLYQYIQWHNNAFEVPHKLDVPSLLIYYEDFHFDKKGNMKRILDFLETPQTREPHDFYYKPYPEHFTKDEYQAIATFVSMVGSAETNKALVRYLNAKIH